MERAACWGLQPVAGSWHSSSKSRRTGLWTLKDLSRVVAGFSLLRAACLFQPSSCLPLKVPSTLCSSLVALPHPLLVLTHLFFLFPSFLGGLGSAQRHLFPPSLVSTLPFSAFFCHVYVHSRYHPLVCLYSVP